MSSTEQIVLIFLVISIIINWSLVVQVRHLNGSRPWRLNTGWQQITELQNSLRQSEPVQLFLTRWHNFATELGESLTKVDFRLAISGALLYAVVFIVSAWSESQYFQWLSNTAPGASFNYLQWLPFWYGLIFLAGAGLFAASPRLAPRYWQLAWMVFVLVRLSQLSQELPPAQFYGDHGSLENFIRSGIPYPAWIVGNSVLNWINVALWQFPPVVQLLPPHLQSVEGFILCASVISIGASAILLIQWWPNRLRILLPLTLPFWLLFGLGYSEYYPFIVGPLVAGIAYILSKPLKEHSPLVISLVAVGLALLYNAFIPVAFAILGWYILANPRQLWKTAGFSTLIACVVLAICWPGSIPDYFVRLYENMNWGSKNTFFVRYAGMEGSPTSIFFSSAYGLSSEHFKDLLFMGVWGGLIVLLILGALAVVLARRMGSGTKLFFWPDVRYGLILTLIVLGVYYFVFMIPKLGPMQDIDLFAWVYVLLAFFVGALWDRLLSGKPYQLNVNYLITSAGLGGSFATLIFLIQVGLPSI